MLYSTHKCRSYKTTNKLKQLKVGGQMKETQMEVGKTIVCEKNKIRLLCIDQQGVGRNQKQLEIVFGTRIYHTRNDGQAAVRGHLEVGFLHQMVSYTTLRLIFNLSQFLLLLGSTSSLVRVNF